MGLRKVLAIAGALAFIGGSDALLGSPQGEAPGKTYTMVSIPKLKAVWFDRLETGLEKAGAQFGVNVSQRAPASADEAQQVRLIEEAINQGSNAILVVPDDARSLEPALARALAQKIVTITHHSPNQLNADFDIEMIDNKAFGERAMEEMVKAMGAAEGEYVVYVGSFTVPDQNIWADAAIALARKYYPGLKRVGDRFPVSGDQNLARQISLDVIAAHPNIKAFLAFGAQGGPGAAQALREKGLVGKVTVVGTIPPSQASQYLKDGSISTSILWDPAEAGYAMVYLAKLVLDGRKSAIGPDVDIPTLGKPFSFKGNTLVYDRPMVVTRDNVDDFSDF